MHDKLRLPCKTKQRVLSFGVMRIRISDSRLLRSWYIKGTDESTLVTDSSVPLMHYDPSDLGSLILIQVTPKERTLSRVFLNIRPYSMIPTTDVEKLQPNYLM